MVLITAYIHLVTRDNKLLYPDASLDILWDATTQGDAHLLLISFAHEHCDQELQIKQSTHDI